MKKIYPPIIALLIMAISCSSPSKEETATIDSSPSTAKVTNNKDAVKALIMPTPVQLASIVKAYNFSYDSETLIPPSKDKIYNSRFERAFASGVYCVDIGYSTLYQDHNKAWVYIKHLDKVMTELDIKPQLGNSYKERFEKNINSIDSLSKIILEAYSYAHSSLIESGEEEYGYYILAGSYLESLNLFCNLYTDQFDFQKRNMLNTLFCQQKIYHDNLMVLASVYEASESTKQLHEFMSTIEVIFSKFDIISKNDKMFEVESLPTMTEIQDLKQKINSFKSSIIG